MSNFFANRHAERYTRVTQAIQTRIKSMTQRLDRGIERQKVLHTNNTSLNLHIDALTARIGEGEQFVSDLAMKINQLERWLVLCREDGVDGALSIDELVCADGNVSNRRLECVALAAAVDDTLSALDRALNQGLIKLDVFILRAKKLAKLQFEFVMLERQWRVVDG